MIIQSRPILRWLGKRFFGDPEVPNAFTLFPFIITKYPRFSYETYRLYLHERVHYWQQLEMLVIPAFIFYFANWFYNLKVKKLPNLEAYRDIILEQEAVEVAQTLKRRRPFGWVSFVKRTRK